MKTLFLGSSGFIGRSLLDSFQQMEEVTVLRRDTSQKSKGKSKIVHGSLDDPETLSILARGKFDRVIDSSWIGLPNRDSINNKKNLLMKKRLIETMSESGVKEFNAMGSCLEYGSITGEVSEESVGVEVEDFGQTKLAVLQHLRESGMSFRWFRIFYVVGVGQHYDSLLNTAIRRLSSGEDFLANDPSKSFDFIALSDVIQGIRAALNSKNIWGVINVGKGDLTSINSLVNIVRSQYNRPTFSLSENFGMYANINKLRDATGWQPKATLDSVVSEILLSMQGK